MGGRHRKSKRFGVELALNSPGPKVKRPLTIDHLDGWPLRLSPGEKHLPRKKVRTAAERAPNVVSSPVCTENLNPDVMVMKSAKDRV